ncbi:MAG TPA: response regulator [Verrucomicrobiae bacterium]|nr:response regulator [Verrucomicrobiae bacterium]
METTTISPAPKSKGEALGDVPGAPARAGVSPDQVSQSVPSAAQGPTPSNNRVLVVDDNPAIHEDFRKVLGGRREPQAELLSVEAALFGGETPQALKANFEIDFAYQGQEALLKVEQSLAAGRPYSMAFVDVRMPPGWDGIETVQRIWKIYPDLQVVICTAYSDYSWEEMIRRLGSSDNLVILKKPFDNVEVLQLACAFSNKWELKRRASLKLDELARMVADRTTELRRANEDLRREVEERLHAERQLRQAQKMEAVGQLAAGVAHDFNNILTVIHGHSSMLLMRLGETGPHAKSLSEIRHSAERAANVVRQLLMFSRKQILQFRNVELGDVIRSVSGMLRQLVGEHVSLETDCPRGLPPVFADRGMIEQVTVNLTLNARDAMPRGGQIRLACREIVLEERDVPPDSERRAGRFVCFSVSDTGCGIDAEGLTHLFEPFYTTKEAGKGTGLGLATVFGIVKQHQGWIEVQSQVKVGSTFTIFFPVSAQACARQPETPETIGPTRGTETILLAEDEPSLRETVQEVLKLQGYRVLAAGSGPDALDVWHREERRIDLLLTDMVMPGGMMGTDVAAELRRSNPELKVIFTTGYSPGVVGSRYSLEEGVNFLPKPYSPTKLAAVIRACLDKPGNNSRNGDPNK